MFSSTSRQMTPLAISAPAPSIFSQCTPEAPSTPCTPCIAAPASSWGTCACSSPSWFNPPVALALVLLLVVLVLGVARCLVVREAQRMQRLNPQSATQPCRVLEQARCQGRA